MVERHHPAYGKAIALSALGRDGDGCWPDHVRKHQKEGCGSMNKVLCAATVFGGIIGGACLCGAIEWQTSVFWPVLILVASGVCGHMADWEGMEDV